MAGVDRIETTTVDEQTEIEQKATKPRPSFLTRGKYSLRAGFRTRCGNPYFTVGVVSPARSAEPSVGKLLR